MLWSGKWNTERFSSQMEFTILAPTSIFTSLNIALLIVLPVSIVNIFGMVLMAVSASIVF